MFVSISFLLCEKNFWAEFAVSESDIAISRSVSIFSGTFTKESCRLHVKTPLCLELFTISLLLRMTLESLPSFGCTDQWRIQDFPEWAPTTKVGVLTYYFAIFFLKTTWKWKNLDHKGRVPGASANADNNICQQRNIECSCFLFQKFGCLFLCYFGGEIGKILCCYRMERILTSPCENERNLKAIQVYFICANRQNWHNCHIICHLCVSIWEKTIFQVYVHLE